MGCLIDEESSGHPLDQINYLTTKQLKSSVVRGELNMQCASGVLNSLSEMFNIVFDRCPPFQCDLVRITKTVQFK